MKARRIAWALWLLAAALLWLFENNAATLALLLASLLLPCCSIALAKGTAKHAALRLAAPVSADKGTPLEISLETKAVLTGTLHCENRLSGEISRLPLRRIPPRLTLSAAHCGVLRLRAEACIEDVFGLWRSAPLPCAEEYIAIQPTLFLPQVSLTETTTVIAEGERYSQLRPGSDPSETFAIREYRPGDPVRQIHWKLSQKTGAPLLRELGLPLVPQTLLVFRNVHSSGEAPVLETADAMAEVFLSVSRALLNDGSVHTAAYAEAGRYVLTEVQNEADFQSLCSRVLALDWETEDDALARLLGETPYAHVAIVSAVLPSDAECYARGNRVTLLTPDASRHAEGVFLLPFSPERAADELQTIEL